MKVTLQRRALDKVYKRRNRYEIPDWQRGKVWDIKKKQALIDSILRDWRLPKFYFVKSTDEEYVVVDGQQRLAAIFDFFENDLPLSASTVTEFGGPYYKDLKPRYSDAFDDYEIDYDEIEEAHEEELKQFFQRLQQGLPLTSSEKLNSVQSKLRDFCRTQASHQFFAVSVSVENTRYAHFDIASKVAVIEIEGIEAGLRFDDIKPIFEAQSNFSSKNAVGKRIAAALDFLLAAFPNRSPLLKSRTLVQSLITLACRLIASGRQNGLERYFAGFVTKFMNDLTEQVELGQAAKDYDFIRFQKSINSNVRSGARTRQEILLRKLFVNDPALAAAFEPSALAESGLPVRIKELGAEIADQIKRLNSAYGARFGDDLFKSTNKTVAAQMNLGRPVKDQASYGSFVSDLYFLFKESVGQRLKDNIPQSFDDVNALRTQLQHDVDHGDTSSIRSKKRKAGSVFKRYSGEESPETLDPERFVLVQASILSALEMDLKNMVFPSN